MDRQTGRIAVAERPQAPRVMPDALPVQRDQSNEPGRNSDGLFTPDINSPRVCFAVVQSSPATPLDHKETRTSHFFRHPIVAIDEAGVRKDSPHEKIGDFHNQCKILCPLWKNFRISFHQALMETPDWARFEGERDRHASPPNAIADRSFHDRCRRVRQHCAGTVWNANC